MFAFKVFKLSLVQQGIKLVIWMNSLRLGPSKLPCDNLVSEEYSVPDLEKQNWNLKG
jgi:hypothetical protein